MGAQRGEAKGVTSKAKRKLFFLSNDANMASFIHRKRRKRKCSIKNELAWHGIFFSWTIKSRKYISFFNFFPLFDFFFLQNNLLPSGETTANGKSVVIQDVSRHHSGIYVCTADNQVGSPASAEIDLKVLCKFSHFKKITRWLDCFDSSKELFLNSLCPPYFRSTRNWSRSVLDSQRRRHRSGSFM